MGDPRDFDPEDIEEYWERQPYIEFLEPGEEYDRAHDIFMDFVSDLEDGMRAQESDAFWEYLEWMGLEESDFDWEAYREFLGYELYGASY